MSAVLDDVLLDLQRHDIRLERHGDRIKWRAASPPPPAVLDRLRSIKPVLLQQLPDADQRVIVRWRSPATPANTWCVALGAPGLTRQQVVDGLLARWPDSEVLP